MIGGVLVPYHLQNLRALTIEREGNEPSELRVDRLLDRHSLHNILVDCFLRVSHVLGHLEYLANLPLVYAWIISISVLQLRPQHVEECLFNHTSPFWLLL